MFNAVFPDNKIVQLPTRWADVDKRDLRFAYRKLADLLLGRLTPFEFQITILNRIHDIRLKRVNKWLHWLTMSGRRYRRWYQSQMERADRIITGLCFIADHITFAFDIDEETKEVKMKYDLPSNPLPQLGKCYFDRGLTVDTNITARQYVDIYDLETAMQMEVVKNDNGLLLQFMRKMAMVLYGISEAKSKKLELWELVLIRFWAQSITAFFVYHPTYSILYKTHMREGAEEHISMGLEETIMQLEKSGYENVSDMNVIKFFQAQVKELKDSLSKAVAQGIKPTQLAGDTGLDLSIINRLVN